MSLDIPRLRVFAGPNGSVKSTIKEALRPEWLGVYVNADEIEKAARLHDRVDLASFELATADLDVLPDFFSQSSLLAKFPRMQLQARLLRTEGTIVNFDGIEVNSYLASVLSDFIRHRLLAAHRSFTFETVMSSPDKVEFMRSARQQGFRTYLYFVATDDPEINIERVRNRVLNGGHPVPTEKIIERYARSLALLPAAIEQSSRAYVFDNSGANNLLIAEITEGRDMELRADAVPHWFMPVLSHYQADAGHEVGDSH